MEIVAVQKYLRMSPTKVRLVADLAREMTPIDAIERLPFSGKRAAKPLVKVLKTAVANAKKQGLNEEELSIKEIQINEGPKLKRWRAGARGRAKPYARRMSHIRVVLTTENNQVAKSKLQTNSKLEKIAKDGSNKTNPETLNPKSETKSNLKSGKPKVRSLVSRLSKNKERSKK
ncbi:50S ribosomal protein L22 [Candidatus Woesebacteria bacterium GWA1_41_8]|jgi:large subunit ribosomal protein L22|uniref:Large ribosomal subunit protein uL22 n=1 Tax=Candidatus Woesebacteria bacterium GWA1_41_8 TaxID=1802471 RepID=A0A1F7WK41_9BACT|nr:MAG: 50S ribosomal protein L22 [Candidatus Woesebacteria bacterium GWA1_41_8]